jgi:NAD(P)-dependent dehydrogenase (short-subunit alcohol dehydrogenase family)
MAVALKPLREQVIVITGASSGIGLATARMAAAAGARVVLAARNAAALADVERQIAAAGGCAAHVPADVGRKEDVRRIAEAAIGRFGGFDTWVNNAGVSIWGRLEQVSDADHRKLFETNFWGVVYGSLTAVEHLRRRGGALVTVGSVASDIALPLQGMYSATKHAVKGFTDALRMELEEEGVPVSVTLIKPTSIDTPLPQRARNYLDREPKLPPPVYAPDEVARAILHAAARPVRDLFVGGSGRVMSAFGRQAPRAMDWLGERVLMPQEVRDEPPRDPEGALHRPGRDGRVRGDHPGLVRGVSVYTRAATHPVLTGALLAVAAGAAVGLLSGPGRPPRR